MCGRLNIHDSQAISSLMSDLGLPLYPVSPPQYNIPPGSSLPVLINASPEPEFVTMDWGIPFGNFRHPNTRAATVARKPWLQRLLLQNRCLVPVNRFYEWPDHKARPDFGGGKTRFCIHTPQDVMFLGGLFRISPDGEMQFNVLTTGPNAQINEFHHRMPVIIAPTDTRRWLASQSFDELYTMMNPWQGELVLYECDSWVDNARHQDARCMAPLGEH